MARTTSFRKEIKEKLSSLLPSLPAFSSSLCVVLVEAGPPSLGQICSSADSSLPPSLLGTFAAEFR